MCNLTHCDFLKANNFGRFVETINNENKIFSIVENTMWIMPHYTPETGVLHVRLFCFSVCDTNICQKTQYAVIQLYLESNKVCCSCPQSKLLLAQNTDKKCWHIMFMQYRKKEIDQMEYCVDDNEFSHETECVLHLSFRRSYGFFFHKG